MALLTLARDVFGPCLGLSQPHDDPSNVSPVSPTRASNAFAGLTRRATGRPPQSTSMASHPNRHDTEISLPIDDEAERHTRGAVTHDIPTSSKSGLNIITSASTDGTDEVLSSSSSSPATTSSSSYSTSATSTSSIPPSHITPSPKPSTLKRTSSIPVTPAAALASAWRATSSLPPAPVSTNESVWRARAHRRGMSIFELAGESDGEEEGGGCPSENWFDRLSVASEGSEDVKPRRASKDVNLAEFFSSITVDRPRSLRRSFRIADPPKPHGSLLHAPKRSVDLDVPRQVDVDVRSVASQTSLWAALG